MKILSMCAVALILGISVPASAENFNTTIQEGGVNTNDTYQEGRVNDNATYQQGYDNWNATRQRGESNRNQSGQFAPQGGSNYNTTDQVERGGRFRE